VLLKTQNLTLTETDVAGEIVRVPQKMQAQLKKHAFFLLENLATRQLLLALARAEAPERKDAPRLASRRRSRSTLDGRSVMWRSPMRRW